MSVVRAAVRCAVSGEAAEDVSRREARRWTLEGRVQGVGFRPFVSRLADDCGLDGWVRNRDGVVELHAEGTADALERFAGALLEQAPPLARIARCSATPAVCGAKPGFRILDSARGLAAAPDSGPDAQRRAARSLPPDQGICDDCLAELRDPQARRYRYPFVNCTQCGPRYTIIRALPYDRPQTTMAGFALCAACEREYADPSNRRFHAQPLACADCGPQLSWHAGGVKLDGNEPALAACIAALRDGEIVAVRGIGGYHLYCDAGNDAAVARLRMRKQRPGKPLALMLPQLAGDPLAWLRRLAGADALQEAALLDAARPIVLLRRRAAAPLAAAVAPGLDEIGVMLPYSPLHHLLLDGFGKPLVATSANRSGEPVLCDALEAEAVLAAIADGFLHHDRPIERPADDTVLRPIAGRLRPLRLGRGTAPLERTLAVPLRRPLLGLGAFGKNTVTLAWGDRALTSPHVGDLRDRRGRERWRRTVADLQTLYGVRAEMLIGDAHPTFPSAEWLGGSPLRTVLHHHAHASALAGEMGSGDETLLCFTWDGIGYGERGELWGGEALLGAPGRWRRVGSWRPLRLPGGDRAAREPWRIALACCWSAGRPPPALLPTVDPLLHAAFMRGFAAPESSAIGRLFDAAAALLGLVASTCYEAEAPMRLEALAGAYTGEPLSLPLQAGADGVWRSDWAPLLDQLLDARRSRAQRAADFHASLAGALTEQALRVRERHGPVRVGLTGGVFQNARLCADACAMLEAHGFEVLMPCALPTNDAALSFGQIVEAAALDAGETG